MIDVLVIGSGPAGISTALHLAKAGPEWARRVTVIDAKVHPREKICGGGLTRPALDVLRNLNLTLALPHVDVREMRVRLGCREYALHDDPIIRVVRRDEFDHWLVQCARERGVTMREGEPVRSVTPLGDGVEVRTARGVLLARTLVVADGSPSFVRQHLDWSRPHRPARLLEVLTPEREVAQSEFFQNGMALFEFSARHRGVQGYYWDFPSLIAGSPMMNRGVFDSRIHASPMKKPGSVKAVLTDSLAARRHCIDEFEIKGHTLRCFDPKDEFSRPRMLLAGDAAGVDPLFGEGISFSLAYGDVAAAELIAAFTRNQFDFAGYRRRLLHHSMLRHLARRRRLASMVYALRRLPRLEAVFWRAAPFYFRWLAWSSPDFVPTRSRRMTLVHNLRQE